jgi:hypothetical protein
MGQIPADRHARPQNKKGANRFRFRALNISTLRLFARLSFFPRIFIPCPLYLPNVRIAITIRAYNPNPNHINGPA